MIPELAESAIGGVQGVLNFVQVFLDLIGNDAVAGEGVGAEQIGLEEAVVIVLFEGSPTGGAVAKERLSYQEFTRAGGIAGQLIEAGNLRLVEGIKEPVGEGAFGTENMLGFVEELKGGQAFLDFLELGFGPLAIGQALPEDVQGVLEVNETDQKTDHERFVFSGVSDLKHELEVSEGQVGLIEGEVCQGAGLEELADAFNDGQMGQEDFKGVVAVIRNIETREGPLAGGFQFVQDGADRFQDVEDPLSDGHCVGGRGDGFVEWDTAVVEFEIGAEDEPVADFGPIGFE